MSETETKPYPWFYAVNDRPVKFEQTPSGGLRMTITITEQRRRRGEIGGATTLFAERVHQFRTNGRWREAAYFTI